MKWDTVQRTLKQWSAITGNHLGHHQQGLISSQSRHVKRSTGLEKMSSGNRANAMSSRQDDCKNTDSTAMPLLEDNHGSRQRLKALKASEARFRVMSDASPLGILATDTEGRCTYTNEAYRTISGLSSQQALGVNWVKMIHPDDYQRVLDELRNNTAETPLHTEFRLLRGDNSVVWARVNIAALHDDPANDSGKQGLVLIVEDISVRKSAEHALREAESALFEEKERAQVTLNSIGDAVLVTDLMGRVTYTNLVAEEMIGWSCEEAVGRPLSEVFNIIDGASRQAAANPARRAIAEDRIIELAANCILIRRDGFESLIEDSAAPIHDRDGNVTGAVIVFHDLSQSRAMVRKMTHQARHDFLTGLPNRALLMERLSQSIGLAQRHSKQVALLFVDLDYFKHINDSLGHAIGDQLLQTAAERLVSCVRVTDTVCRHGGDEFVILLAEIEHPEDATHVAEKLQAAFSEPQFISGQKISLTLSIGISIYPDHADNMDVLMHNADLAMYYVKQSGRNGYRFYSTDMSEYAGSSTSKASTSHVRK